MLHPRSQQKRQRGQLGETLAAEYLSKRGYRLLSRNFRSHFGEIDLIFQKDTTVVFVEVKTRFDASFGTPFESVTRWKLQNIVKTAYYFQLLHPELPKSMRIDAVGVFLNVDGEVVNIKHLENVTV